MRGTEIRVGLDRKTDGARVTVTDGELLANAICSRAAGGAILPASLIIEELGSMQGFRKRIINGPPLLKELIIFQGSFVYAVSHLSRLPENEVAPSP